MNLVHSTSYESATEQVNIIRPQFEEAEKEYQANHGILQIELRYLSLKK